MSKQRPGEGSANTTMSIETAGSLRLVREELKKMGVQNGAKKVTRDTGDTGATAAEEHQPPLSAKGTSPVTSGSPDTRDGDELSLLPSTDDVRQSVLRGGSPSSVVRDLTMQRGETDDRVPEGAVDGDSPVRVMEELKDSPVSAISGFEREHQNFIKAQKKISAALKQEPGVIGDVSRAVASLQKFNRMFGTPRAKKPAGSQGKGAPAVPLGSVAIQTLPDVGIDKKQQAPEASSAGYLKPTESSLARTTSTGNPSPTRYDPANQGFKKSHAPLGVAFLRRASSVERERPATNDRGAPLYRSKSVDADKLTVDIPTAPASFAQDTESSRARTKQLGRGATTPSPGAYDLPKGFGSTGFFIPKAGLTSERGRQTSITHHELSSKGLPAVVPIPTKAQGQEGDFVRLASVRAGTTKTGFVRIRPDSETTQSQATIKDLNPVYGNSAGAGSGVGAAPQRGRLPGGAGEKLPIDKEMSPSKPSTGVVVEAQKLDRAEIISQLKQLMLSSKGTYDFARQGTDVIFSGECVIDYNSISTTFMRSFKNQLLLQDEEFVLLDHKGVLQEDSISDSDLKVILDYAKTSILNTELEAKISEKLSSLGKNAIILIKDNETDEQFNCVLHNGLLRKGRFAEIDYKFFGDTPLTTSELKNLEQLIQKLIEGKAELSTNATLPEPSRSPSPHGGSVVSSDGVQHEKQ